MKIDLKSDFATARDHLAQRVKDYPVYVNLGPGNDDDAITQITLGYQVFPSAWIAVVFDTRPRSKPDGEWNRYINDNKVKISNWSKAIRRFFEKDEPIDLVTPSGRLKRLGDDDDPLYPIGRMLRDVLKNARDEGLFNNLPLADGAIMGVEEHDGEYSWPSRARLRIDGAIRLTTKGRTKR